MSIKNLAKVAMVSIVSFAFAGVALAYSPNFSVVKEGTGDSARFTITGAGPFSSINLYRRQGTALWTTISNFGQTDGSGYFNQVASLGSDNSTAVIEQYVVVNGQQSNIVQINPFGYTGGGCGISGCGPSGSTQRNINLALGQSQSIVFDPTVYGTPIYISSNSSPSVASASILNNYNVYFTGLTSGTSTIVVCQNNYNFCVTYLVAVGGVGSYGSLTFSQNGAALAVGQNTTVQIFSSYASSGAYYLSSNSNSSVVSASVSSNSLYLVGQTTGASNVSVCQYNTSACGTVVVTVSGGGTVSFNPPSAKLVQGQSQTVTVYSSQNSFASFYITGNTTNNAVIATVSSSANTINLFANTSGSGQITVCQSGTLYCGTLYVSVGGSNLPVSLSQNNLPLQPGQSASVSIYGSGNFYVSSNSSPSVAVPTVVNNQINVYASSAGSANIVICSQNGGNCATLAVNVGNVLGTNTGVLYFSATNLPQPQAGQYYNQQLSVYGGNAPYSFVLQSGNLPAGLFLSASGQIYGTAQSGQSGSFSIRATDIYGRVAIADFVLITNTIPTPAYPYPPIYPPVYTPAPAVLGASIYPSGRLISESGTVYIVYNGTKNAFSSQAVFRALGFKLSNVQEVGDSGLEDSGYSIQSAKASHPWGAWIKSGKTVYFVHENGLIPVPDYSTLLNNGGQLRYVVPANRYDFALPVLPAMEHNDDRVR